MGDITMSIKEIDRLKITQQIENKQITIKQATSLLGVSYRHAKRIWKNYCTAGAEGLISKKRGQPSNRRMPTHLQQQALQLIREHYHDFGPTLASEKLAANHGLRASRETIRKLMIANEIWTPKRRYKTRVYQRRNRRSCVGELVQADGSIHDWFEGRGPKCTLLVFVDDASSRLMALQFVQAESVESYFLALRLYLEKWGCPRTFYTDRHSVFKVSREELKRGTGITQWNRAVEQLGINHICARSPQAKGRVERVNRILQDRLVKELRLQNISSIEEANTYLPTFIDQYNARFEVAPACPFDAHRPLNPSHNLDLILAIQGQRTVSKNLEISFENKIYQLQGIQAPRRLQGSKATILRDPHGKVRIIHQDKELDWRIYGEPVPRIPEIDRKQLDALLDGLAPQLCA